MVEYLRIPRERLAILRKEPKIIKQIEAATNTKIEIYPDAEQVEVLETNKMKDPLATWKARDTIKAIGRGFAAKTAFRLLEEENAALEVVELNEFAKKGKKSDMERIKGRVIGAGGSAKQRIADLTDTDIVVYGKTTSIIGNAENAAMAKRAIEMLCEGAMHTTVFKMLLSGRMRKR